jgi:hypothetical protein
MRADLALLLLELLASDIGATSSRCAFSSQVNVPAVSLVRVAKIFRNFAQSLTQIFGFPIALDRNVSWPSMLTNLVSLPMSWSIQYPCWQKKQSKVAMLRANKKAVKEPLKPVYLYTNLLLVALLDVPVSRLKRSEMPLEPISKCTKPALHKVQTDAWLSKDQCKRSSWLSRKSLTSSTILKSRVSINLMTPSTSMVIMPASTVALDQRWTCMAVLPEEAEEVKEEAWEVLGAVCPEAEEEAEVALMGDSGDNRPLVGEVVEEVCPEEVELEAEVVMMKALQEEAGSISEVVRGVALEVVAAAAALVAMKLATITSMSPTTARATMVAASMPFLTSLLQHLSVAPEKTLENKKRPRWPFPKTWLAQ